VLGAFQGKAVAALLGKGFLGNIFGEFQAFGFHADVLHKGHVGAKVLGKAFFHIPDTFADNGPKALPLCHLMDDGQGVEPVAEA